MQKTRGRLGREKAVVSPSFTTTAPFRGRELVNRLELVYVLSYLVLLFKIFSFISVLFSFNDYVHLSFYFPFNIESTSCYALLIMFPWKRRVIDF